MGFHNEQTFFVQLNAEANQTIDLNKVREVCYYLNSCVDFLRHHINDDPKPIPESTLKIEMAKKILEVCEIVASLGNDVPKKIFYELLYGAHYAMQKSNDGMRFKKIKEYFRDQLCPEPARAVEKELLTANEFGSIFSN